MLPCWELPVTPLAACDAHRDALVAPSQAGHTHHVTEPPLPTTDDNMSVGLGTIETNATSRAPTHSCARSSSTTLCWRRRHHDLLLRARTHSSSTARASSSLPATLATGAPTSTSSTRGAACSTACPSRRDALCAHLDVILYAHEYENWNWCQNDGLEICSFETRLRAPRKIANNHASRYTPPAVSDRERPRTAPRCTRASSRTPTTNATHAAVRAACGDAHTTPALCTARALRARCARQIYMRFLHQRPSVND